MDLGAIVWSNVSGDMVAEIVLFLCGTDLRLYFFVDPVIWRSHYRVGALGILRGVLFDQGGFTFS